MKNYKYILICVLILTACSFSVARGQINFSTIAKDTVNTNLSLVDVTDTKPIYEVFIDESSEEQVYSGLASKGGGVIFYWGASLKQILGLAYDVSEFAVLGEDTLLSKKYDIRVTLPRGDIELVENVLQSAIEDKLGVKGTYSEKEIDVLSLTAPEGASKELYLTEGGEGKFSSSEGTIAAQNSSINSRFLERLEEILRTRIVDETGLEGNYDFQLYWDHDNPKSIISSLENQLGLKLESSKMKMKVLEVEKVSKREMKILQIKN